MTLTISPDQNHAVCDGVKLRAVDRFRCVDCYFADRQDDIDPCESCAREIVWLEDRPSELMAVAREMLHAIDCPWLYDTPDKINDLANRARRVIEAAEKGEMG